jgi:uncharacterized protein YndB with AHSA1/START domain
MPDNRITIETIVNKPIKEVWEKYTVPKHIMEWNHASDDWYSPSAENDLRVGGTFTYKMAARDGSYSFDFSGVYDEVVKNKKIVYTLDDGRRVFVEFNELGDRVKIVTTFEAEQSNPLDMQKAGWQAILDNFKKYVDNN